MDDYEDSNLGENDPYEAVRDSERQGIRPGFLGGAGGGDKPSGLGGRDTLRSAENNASGGGKSDRSKKAGNAASKAASIATTIATKGKSGGAKGGSGGGGFFSGSGKSSGKGKGKGKLAKYSAGAAVLMCVLIFGFIFIALSTPTFMIATIDYNLQDSLGFSETVAILEEQSEHVTVSMLKNGEFPSEYAADLAQNGIDVGQVTANGDFIRTNTYIADLGSNEIAASGDYRVHSDDSGSLAILYNDRIITADNFIAAVESDPVMYAAYAEATDISARFYYSDDVNKVYNDMGVSRGNFYNWEPTGNSQEDQQSFNDTLAQMLDSDSDLSVGGYSGSNDSSAEITIKSSDDASAKVTEVSGKIKDSNTNVATTKAAQLLNSAISSNEPYKAAKVFIAIEEPIQRARIGDNGPVNEVMTVLSTPSTLTYTDVNTGEEITKEASILSTPNFAAAVSKGNFSTNEANNFSRDRVLKATGTADSAVITDTAVSTESSNKSKTVLGMGTSASADDDELQKASDSVAIAATEQNSELFTTIVGGNRGIEGGSFINNTINQKTLGAMPSDESTIVAYRHKAEEILARKAEAERATKSPFDISSPYTFMGSIVHSMARAYIKNSASYGSGTVVGSAVGTTATLAGGALKGLIGGAVADGDDDGVFTTVAGDCYTVNTAANVEGDIYCNSHNTISTKYMQYDADDWAAALPNDLENGKIKERSDSNGNSLSNFVTYGMDREATVGVKSVDVCEAYRKEHSSLLGDLISGISKLFGMYESCSSNGRSSSSEDDDGNVTINWINGVPVEVSTGSRYTLSGSNSSNGDIEKYSGYMLYDTVSSLLSSRQSSVSVFREEYYAKYPKDNSEAGIIARRSGMSKAEAQIALDYSTELTRIAKYDPSTKYAFGRAAFAFRKKDTLVEYSGDIQVSLYCIWVGKTEYADVRNRNLVA